MPLGPATPSKNATRPAAAPRLAQVLGDELRRGKPSAAPTTGAVPCPADILLDALKLRSEANRGSVLGPVSKLATMATGAQEDDSFQMLYGATGVVEKLAPSFSRGIVGAGMNVLVLGTGSTTVADRHNAFANEVGEIWHGKETFSFDGIFRMTSLTQQVAVFWRTMARSLYNVTKWTLAFGAKIPGLGGSVASAQGLIEAAAATKLGRTMTFLNKWIPLLNAAWIMMAAKTAWDVTHDAKASSTAKTIAVSSVAVSMAAVWAGIYTSGVTFMAVTFGSIVLDLLLAQTRHRDKTVGDSDQLAKRYLTHPWEGAVAGARWSGQVATVIGGRLSALWNRLWGNEPTPVTTKKAPPAAPAKAFNPRKKLTTAG